MKRATHRLLLILFLLSMIVPINVWAQEEEGSITFELRKIFGFRFTNRIQGRFNLLVDGPDDLERVEILVDGEVIFEISEQPFKYEFSSSQFTPGLHSFSAVGYTTMGKILQSSVGEYNVLSVEQAQEGLSKYYLPLIVGVVVIMGIVGLLSSVLTGRKGSFRIGEYGPAGGAVCKRCGIPFSRHVLSPNLVIGKLERCPNCGAVVIVRRGSQVELDAAEQRLLADLQAGRSDRVETEEERLNRMIEDSRFDDF